MTDLDVQAMRQVLTGWGRTAPTAGQVVAPVGEPMAEQLVTQAPARGVIARGLGRSYGDAAQNAGGRVIDATSLTGVHSFDVQTGRLRAQAGLSLDALMRWLVPLGWFPPVTPGTRHVTLGGAVAADIHGKNHHVDGSFADSVESLRLVTPTGTREVSLGDDPDLFLATAGGMGLTGLIADVTVQLHPISTSRMMVDTERADNLDDLLARMEASDHQHRYSVAWIDLLAQGAATGRAVLTRGRHAEIDELPPLDRTDPLAFDPSTLVSVPPWVPSGLLNRLTVRTFNELWFRKAPTRRVAELQSLAAFFHPLDAIADWNRIYGPRGMLQYQFVVPFGAEVTLQRIVERLAAVRLPSFLAVLKRFGEASGGHLSFPIPGWTLALDIPVGDSRLADLLRGFDEAVASAGGRVYLAKDSRLSADMVAVMYPRLDQWRDIQRRIDPAGTLTSDLGRRLRLTAAQRSGTWNH